MKERTAGLFAYITLIFYLFTLSPLAYAQPYEPKAPELPFYGYADRGDSGDVFTCEINPGEDSRISYGDVELFIPAGAVDEKVSLTIEKLPGVKRLNEGMSNVTRDAAGYRFGPHPFTFKKSIRVSLPYDRSVNDSEASLADLKMWFYNEEHNSWEGLPVDRVDQEKSVITGITNHFTDMITSTLTLPESPGPINFDPNSIKELEAADPGSIVPQVKGLEPGPMGGASFSIPLRLPSGRGKAFPQLALSYNVNSPNSWMGKGFDISVPSVTTDTRLGLPEYDGYDTYMLEGQELVLDSSMDTDSYKQYVLRNEGSFQRIERFIQDGEDWWQVTSRDGTKKTYGTGLAWSGASGAQVFTWYLKSIVDSNGNRVDYSYVQDQGYTYTESISWTGYDGETAPYKAVFNRESRGDVRSDARGRYMSKLGNRLTSLDIKYYDEKFRGYRFDYRYNVFGQSELTAYEELDGEGNRAYRYEFGYEELEETGDGYWGFEDTVQTWGDNLDESLSENHTITGGASIYTGVSIKIWFPKLFGFRKLTVAQFGISGSGAYSQLWDSSSLMDVDGNGLPDLTWQSGSSLHFLPNTGFDISSDEETFSGASFVMNQGDQVSFNIGVSGGAGGLSASYSKDYSWSNGISTFADINGDGLVDIIKRDNDRFRLNTGTSFGSPEWGTISSFATEETSDTLARKADFDRGYYIEEPVKKWIAWKPGTVRVVNDIQLSQSELRSEAGVKAILDYPDRDGDIPFYINGNNTSAYSNDLVTVSKDDPLYFVLDTLGEIKDESIDDNSDCFADDVNWSTKISYEEIELFHDVIDDRPYYFFEDSISLSRYNSLPDYLEDYYTKASIDEEYYGKLNGGSSSRFNSESPGVKKQIRDWQYDRNLFIPRSIPSAIFNNIFAFLSNWDDDTKETYETYKYILLTLYIYNGVTGCFELKSLSLKDYLEEAFSLILPHLSSGEKSQLGRYYLLGRRMEWSYDTIPMSQEGRSDVFANRSVSDSLDISSATLGTSTSDGYVLIDRTPDGDKTVYSLLDRKGNSVTVSTDSEILASDIAATSSGNTYSFKYDGITRSYGLTYYPYPDLIPEGTYEDELLPLILADENIGANPLGELDRSYLDGFIQILDGEISSIRELIDATDPAPTEEELIALNGELQFYQGKRDLFTDNYTLSDLENIYILNSPVSDEDYKALVEEFRDDFMGADNSELYSFTGSPDRDTLFLLLLSSDNRAIFESYCGLTESDLVLLDDGSWTVVPAKSAEIQESLKFYRAMEEVFPYYTDEGDSYAVGTLSADEESIVAALMSEADILVASGLQRTYTYHMDDSYPVYEATLAEEEMILPVNSMDGPAITGIPGSTYNYVKYLNFDDNGDSIAQRIYFPQFDTGSDFSVSKWADISVDNYELAEDITLPGDVSSALESFVSSYEASHPDPEFFGGGYRNWYYGFWSAFYDWNPANIGKDPDPESAYGTVVDEEGEELDVKTELPQFFIGATYNQYGDQTGEDAFYEGIGGKYLAEKTWMGSVSTYSASYVGMNDSGTIEPVYREFKFAPYFAEDGRWHPMRRGGLQYYSSPEVKASTTGGGSSLGDFRESRTEGSTITGGVSFAGLGISGGKGESKTYTVRDLRDMDGDRIPDLIKLDNGSRLSVKKGTGSGFGETYYMGDSYSYIGKSSSESYNFGASPAPGSQETVRRQDGEPLFEIVKPPSDSETIDNTGMSAGGSVSFSGGYSESGSSLDLYDMNGDGLPDHVSRSGNGDFSVRYNDGGSFSLAPSQWGTSFQDGLSKTLSGSFGISVGVSEVSFGISAGISGSNNKTEYQLMDINGDGLPDQVEKLDNTNYFKVRFNRGDAFSADTLKIYCPDWGYTDDTYKAQLESDINTLKKSEGVFGGMGLDLDEVGDTSSIFDSSKNPFSDSFEVSGITDTLSSSNGITFTLGASYNFAIQIIPPDLFVLDITPGLNGALASSTSNIRMIDMNGSGAPDHVLKAPGKDFLLLRVNRMARVGQLRSIYLPQGGSYSLEYGRSANTTMDPHSRWYLTAVVKNDGYEDTGESIHTYRTEFSYGQGQYDRVLREFFGFDRVTIKSGFTLSGGEWVHTGNRVEKYYYNDDYYRKGVEEKTIVYDGDGNEVNLVEREYENSFVTAGSSFYQLKNQTTTNTDPETGNSLVKREAYTYDDAGNITRLASRIDGAPESQNYILELGYYQDWDKYIVGLPNSLKAYWGSSALTSHLIRRRSADYDVRGNLVYLDQYYGQGETEYNRTTLTYDSKYGNLMSVTDPLGYRLEYDYGYDSRFVTAITSYNTSNPSDTFASAMDWDPVLGVETVQTEVNENSLTKRYDSFGRLREIRTEYDTGDIPAVSYSYFTDSFPWRAATSNKISFDGDTGETMETLVTIDGLGRATQTAKEGVVSDGDGNKSRGWNCSGAIYYDGKARPVMQGQTRFQIMDYTLPLEDGEFPDATEMKNPTTTYYDSLDRVVQVDLPEDGDGHVPTMYTDYRIDRVGLTGASSASGSSEYHQGTVQTDPLGNVTEVWKNGRGHIAAIVKKGDTGQVLTEMSYKYDLLGELLSTSDFLGNRVLFEYDLLGRTVSQESPDGGVQEFTYNREGQLTAKRDSNLTAQGKSIGYEYDNHNRLIRIDYPYSDDVVYTYGTDPDLNNKGRLIGVTNGSVTTEYEYGRLGEITRMDRTINRLKPGASAETAGMSYRSDYLGRMESITYEDGEVLKYGYDEGGQVVSATGTRLGKDFEYVKDIGYDEYGQRVYMEYGDGTETRYTYDETRRWLDNLKTTRTETGQIYQNMQYTFDDVGNIIQTDNSDTYHHSTVQNYTYDGLYQLTSAAGSYELHLNGNMTTGRSQYTQNFTYDKIGNMLTKESSETKSPNVSVSALNYTKEYTYYAAAPHRAEIIGNMYYRYDPNGNVIEERLGGHSEENNGGTFSYTYPEADITRASQAFGWNRGDGTETDTTYCRTYTWDEENRLTGTSDPSYTTVYSYDHEGERTVKYSDLGETLYFDSMWLEADTDGTGRLRRTKNIYIGETRIASKLNYEGEGVDYESSHTFYYHTDHLSSSNVVTDSEGDVYEHMEYTPYGEKWILDQNDSSKYDMIPYRFTAEEWDEETGLYYMSARYQNPETSRWVSSDPAGWGLVNPMDRKGNLRRGFNLVESMNPYSYTGHNPVRYNDPTGLESADAKYSRQEVMNETYSSNYSQDAEDNKNIVEPLLNTDDVQPGYPTWRGHNVDGLPNEPGAQDGITWCNRLLYRAFIALGGDGSKITNENGIGYTKANEMVDLLRAGVASGNVIPAKGGAAQYYANEGMLVIAGLKARRGNGHVALVVGDQFKYDRSRGPLTMQAGSKVGNIYASEGFGEASLGSIEYFVILDGFLK